MALRDVQFTDLILLPDGRGLLKGVPGHDQQLVPVSGQDCSEIKGLPTALSDAFRSRKSDCDLAGLHRHPETIRFEHCDIRYRVAAFDNVDTGRTWFLRRLADSILPLESIGLPEPLVTWLLAEEQSHGLVLISGAQASGKTWTAASLIQARLSRYGGHGVTFENPVEMPLTGPHGEHGYCFQTEILGEHELASHIERAHRYGSPNVIHIGEIRSKHAATEALRVSLGSTRQMVVATIHGLDVVAALDRLLTWAREQEGEAASRNLENSLLAVIHQDLVSEDGKRRLRCPEFLLVPFKPEFKGVRAKLKDGNLNDLRNDMREQKNRITYKGLEGFL